MDPASIIALITLGGPSITALWKIANGLGRFEGPDRHYPGGHPGDTVGP